MVGIISAHWEWVELILERAIAEIMEHPFPRVALLTNSISFYTKCDLILVYARVYEKTEPDTWKQFTSAILALKTAYRGRNEFVHGMWKRDADTGVWGKAEVRTKGGKQQSLTRSYQLKEWEKQPKTFGKQAQTLQRFASLMASCFKHSSVNARNCSWA